ncbi:NapC/NirT family cytochrome c, partial [bacterium]|nr:NapC/NirT family cytochrome c [bacterium]
MAINVFRHIRNNIGLFLFSMVLGILLGFAILYASHAGLEYSSTDNFCEFCHVHPHATYSWKKSTHYKNKSGTIVHCVDCHLPPGGLYYLTEKARLGIRDSYGAVFKDKEKIDWDAKSVLEHAATYTYDASCMKCHQDLYSLGLTPKGVKAHEYYMKQPEKVRCINCHIAVGHYQEKPAEEITIGEEMPKIERPKRPVDSDEFVSYTQTIPETDVTFDMIAIPGGTFMMGSPDSEPYRDPDEGPQREVKISPFWMGEIEVSWREFNVFYTRT